MQPKFGYQTEPCLAGIQREKNSILIILKKIHVNRDQRTTSVQSSTSLAKVSWLHMS